MSPTSDLSNASPPLSPAARVLWAVLILATLYLCYFYNLGAIGLVGPDEPRYAWIARDMAETGDWVTPRLYGKPWFEKPPLYYWGAALSFKILGVSEAAARLPSAICALLATLAMAWLAWRVYGAETARWVLLLLPTTVGMIGFSHAAATDMPFAAMLTVAMVFAAKLLNLIPPVISSHSLFSFTSLTSSTSFTSFFLGFFLGLSTLAKGPAALVLSAGGVLLWALLTKRWRDALRCLHPVAIASFCLTALPWYILCSLRNPDFFRVFIIEHNFKRFLTPEFQHIQPFWYYAPILLIAFLPWTIVLVSAVIWGTAKCWQKRQLCISPATAFLGSWAVFCLLFFSISQSKLPGYILPTLPPLGLLVAREYLARDLVKPRALKWVGYAFMFMFVPAAVLLFWFGHSYAHSEPQSQKMQSAGLMVLLLGFANLALTSRANSNLWIRQSAPLCAVPVLILLAFFGRLSSPWLTPDPSAKMLTRFVATYEHQLPYSEFFVLSANRNLKYGLSFYLAHEVQVWDPDHPRQGFLLVPKETTAEACDRFLKQGWHCATKEPLLDREPVAFVAYRVWPPKPAN